MGMNLSKIGSIVSIAKDVVEINNMVGGVDFKNLTPNSISGIGGSIESKLNGISSDLTNKLTSSIKESDIQSMAGNIDIEGKVNNLINSSGANGVIDESEIESMVNQAMSNISLQDLNFM